MTRQEGKNFLAECLQNCDCNDNIDNLIIYTTGTKSTADQYQKDEITTKVDFSNVAETVQYVVKCFTHLEIYAAWSREICEGNGKCIAYKNNLCEMVNAPDKTYSVTNLGNNQEMYWFRGREGAEQFIREHLLNNEHNEN